MRFAPTLSALVAAALFCLASSLLLAALPSGAFAQSAEADAKKAFDRGVEASRREAWSEASQHFRSSLALAPRASTLWNLAIALDRSREWHEFFLVVERYLELSDPTKDAEDRAQLTALRDAALAKTARLSIALTPEDARLTIDGELVREPKRLHLAPGEHRIEARTLGHAPYEATLELHAGEERTLRIELERVPSSSEPRVMRAPGPQAPQEANEAQAPRASAIREPAPARATASEPDRDESTPLWQSPVFLVAAGVGAALIVGAIVLVGSHDPGTREASGGNTGIVF